jgi:putative tricarboxylic transport membrane protein
VIDFFDEREKNGVGKIFSRLKGPLLILLFTLFFYFLAGKIEETPIPGQVGPAFWPKAILLFLMISCGIKGVEILAAWKRESKVAEGEPPQAVDFLKLFAMIGLVIGVVVAMDFLGFLLANFLFLLSFMRLAGLKKKIHLLLTSSLGTIFLLYLFVKVVYLPLPKGYWFFYDLTVYLYRLLRII